MQTVKRSNGKLYTLKDNHNRFLFPGEYMKLFDNLKKKQKHSITIQINTGARVMELQNVKKEDCYINDKRIILRVTKTKARKGETHGKQRMLPISTQFSKYLAKTTKPLQGGEYIGVLSTPAYNIGLKKAAQKAGIKDWYNISSHTIRKTLECWLMSLGIQDSALLAHFGHDLRTAASHYVSPDVFTLQEKSQMKIIIGDLYAR